MNAKKTGLGSDPLSWISPTKPETKTSKTTPSSNVIAGKVVQMVPVSSIIPDPKQPRKNIKKEEKSIQALSESIKQHGFINFITVREIGKKRYEIVAGERRFQAAKLANIKKIPVIIITEDKKPLDYALIQLEENLQRVDLTAFEESETYIRFKEDFLLQQKDIVERTGRSKAYISKMMKLGNIDLQLKKTIESHEKMPPREVLFELAGYESEEQIFLWKNIKTEPSISNFEKIKKRLENKKKGKTKRKIQKPAPDTIFEALKRAIKKDINAIYKYIPPKKIEALLKEFSS